MGKNVGLTYGEFKFPSEQGFTGSAGKNSVKGYQRGGRVKMPKNVKGKGGRVKKQMGGYMGPEREIAVDDVKITVPKKRGGSVHDNLKREGGKMGYAYGGQVKDTSGEFKEKRGKMDSMDTGNQPARKGRNQQEVEAGGTKKLKPGYMHGGGVHSVRDRTKGKGKSRRGFPASVKAKGGLARYAAGGAIKKAGAAQ